MKRGVCCCLLITIIALGIEFAPSEDAYATSKLRASYNRVVAWVKKNEIPNIGIEWKEYKREYKDGKWKSVKAYEKAYYNLFEISDNGEMSVNSASSEYASGSNSLHNYYYNTGKTCPEEAVYENSTYDLLNSVKKGDIIYEKLGGAGFTGHCAIVEGKFYDSEQKRYYIRIIEAIDKGVKRGILDDIRMKEKGVTILRVKKSYKTGVVKKKTVKIENYNNKVKAAVKFAISQLEKKYWLDVPAKNKGADEKDWYCSELVWASYKNQGINIEKGLPNQPGITPSDIKKCKRLQKIKCYK